MFVDASALVAIIVDEEDAAELTDRLSKSPSALLTSPIAIFETALAVARLRRATVEEAEATAIAYVSLAMTIIPITPEIGRLAIDARARYGRGTGHPAQLNMGDCFAYACARAHGVPLLYKGEDFAHTDLA